MKLNKIVHDNCKDVPHDIGLELEKVVQSVLNTLLARLESEIDDAGHEYKKTLKGQQPLRLTTYKKGIWEGLVKAKEILENKAG